MSPPTTSNSTASARLQPALRKALSFPVLLGVLLAAGAFTATSWQNGGPGSKIFVEGDTWWHLAVGERILATHSWPTTVSNSFTAAGSPWIAYEWLGEVMIALAGRLRGLQGMGALLVGLSIAFMLLLYYLAYLRSGNAKAAAVACALLLTLLGPFFTLRPQLLGYSFLALMLICLELFRQGREKAVWFLPGVVALWVNTHGNFVFGLGVLGLYWVSGWFGFRHGMLVATPWTPQQSRKLGVICLLCTLVLPITPYGARLPANVLQYVLQPLNLANNSEWYSVSSVHDLRVTMFLSLVLLFALANSVLLPAVYRLEEIVLLLLAVFEASQHVRFVLLFVPVFAPLMATSLTRLIPGYHPTKDKYALNAVLITLTLAGLTLAFPTSRDFERMLREKVPERAAQFLRQRPDFAPYFNEIDWGGYLLWSGQKVFIDGRIDAYEPSGAFSDYLGITSLDRNTLFLLQKYGVKACLLKSDSPLGTFFRVLPDWEEAYSDRISTVFVRRSGATKYPLTTDPDLGGRAAVRR